MHDFERAKKTELFIGHWLLDKGKKKVLKLTVQSKRDCIINFLLALFPAIICSALLTFSIDLYHALVIKQQDKRGFYYNSNLVGKPKFPD